MIDVFINFLVCLSVCNLLAKLFGVAKNIDDISRGKFKNAIKQTRDCNWKNKK